MARYYGQFNPPVDQLISAYFPPDYTGCAVDVGATDGRYINNTLHFEERGWDVLCIEANPLYQRALAANRRRTLSCAVSNENRDRVTFHVVRLAQVNDYSSISSLEVDGELLQNHRDMGFQCEETDIQVNARTLDHCVAESPLAKIDFISIDVEGVELRVLQGFNIRRWKPRLMVIESNTADQSNTIQGYLRQFGYVLDKRAEVNDFFVPDGA
jgi:FkbM family methyltransferase